MQQFGCNKTVSGIMHAVVSVLCGHGLARINATKHYNERFAHSTTNLLVLLLIAGASGPFDATFYV